jgi:hypothetical protein
VERKGNAPQRSCVRTDVKFNKYNHLGHISKICKFQLEKKQEETQIVDQEDYQLFVAIALLSKHR